MTIQEHVALAPLTTLGVGGEARYFVDAHTVDEVREALDFAREKSLDIFILGGGSNILIADSGFDGVVIRVEIPGISIDTRDVTALVTVGAGVEWDTLVAFTVEHALAGLECLSGVPGTVGGAVVANLGCYGEQCSDTFISADVIDLSDTTGTVRTLTKGECDFSYHDSIFCKNPNRYIVLKATFALITGGKPKLSYRDNRFDIATLASLHVREPSLADVRRAILDIREEKGTLIMDGRLSYKCAGSFFHMPYVSAEKYDYVLARAQALDSEKEKNLRPWAWQQQNGSYKLAPGFLLEYTEFQRGYTRGQVGISPKHTLTIINIGRANSEDIAKLARDMHSAVKNIFAVDLEREVEYVGSVEKEIEYK